MGASTNRIAGVGQILQENTPYQPLGAKIRKLAYRFPPKLPGIGPLREYLKKIREVITSGGLPDISHFYQDLNLHTANLDSFENLNIVLWREFQETYRLIVEKILTSNGNGNGATPSFKETALQKAIDFLRPLATMEIPEDPDHVWGFITPGVEALRVGEMPQRCASHYLEMDAERVLNLLTTDLHESFERRHNPQLHRPAKDQCSEPQHPARFRISAQLTGPDQIDENREAIFSYGDSISQLEYGENYKWIQPAATQFDWEVTHYTCKEKAPLETEIRDGALVLKAPPVLDDRCVASIKLTMTTPFTEPKIATREVRILNTENEPPVVQIKGPTRSTGVGPVTLEAKAQDPNGDPLTYQWKNLSRFDLRFDGKIDGTKVKFYHPKVPKESPLIMELTVTDQPKGLRPGPQAVVARQHKIILGGDLAKEIEGLPDDPKRKGIQDIAKVTGSDPLRFATPKSLEEAILDAAVPEEVVTAIDLILLIDSSGSMADDVETVKNIGPTLLGKLKEKVAGGDLSKVRIGVVSYVDDKRTVHAHLMTMDGNILRVKLEEVIKAIQEVGGGLETIWDALWQTIGQERWNKEKEAHRVVIYLTDEGGNPGKLGKKEADVAQIAVRKQVKVEPIFLQERLDALAILDQMHDVALALKTDERKMEFFRGYYYPFLKKVFEEDAFGILKDVFGEVVSHPEGFGEAIASLRDDQTKLAYANETLLIPWIKGGNKNLFNRAVVAYEKVLLSLSDENERVKQARAFYPYIASWSGRIGFLREAAWGLESEGRRLQFLREVYLPQLLQKPPPDQGSDLKQETMNLLTVLEKSPEPQKRLALYKEFLLPLNPDLTLSRYWKVLETMTDPAFRSRFLRHDFWEAIETAIQKEGADHLGQHHLDRFGDELLKIQNVAERLKIADETLLKLSKKGAQHAHRVAKWVYDRVKKGLVK